MADIDLTQGDADALIALAKIRGDEEERLFPQAGGSLVIPLTSEDRRENFLLDIHRGRIDLRKGTYQNRARQVVVLVRLDFGGPPHRNPDGQEVPCPHLHLFREGFADKWAIPVPIADFPNIGDLWSTFSDFMRYCNVVAPPRIDRGLFA